MDSPGRGGSAMGVVEVEDAVGVVASQGEGVGERPGAAGDAALPPARPKAPGPKGDVGGGPARAPTSQDVDHPTHRVGAIKGGRGPSHDLDPLDVVGADGPEVEAPARFVDGHSVQQDLHVIRLASPQEDGSRGAERAVAGHRQPGHMPKRVGDILDPGSFQRLPVDDRDVGRHRPLGRRPPVRGDHEPLQRNRLLLGFEGDSRRYGRRCGREGGQEGGQEGHRGRNVRDASHAALLPRGRRGRRRRLKRRSLAPSPPRGGVLVGAEGARLLASRPSRSPSQDPSRSPSGMSNGRCSGLSPGPRHSGGAAPASHRLP